MQSDYAGGHSVPGCAVIIPTGAYPRTDRQRCRCADVQMCHNLAHGDLLGYGVLDMGMGCVVWSATGAVHSWRSVVMGAIGAGLLPYSPTALLYSMCEADSAMVSAGVLEMLWCLPSSCPGCQDLAIFINVWK